VADFQISDICENAKSLTAISLRCELLYDCESSVRFAEDLFAVPIKALWELK
jgi:hypothetical protein